MNPDNTNPNTGVPVGPTPSPAPEPTPAPQPTPPRQPTPIHISEPTPTPPAPPTPPVNPPQPVQPSPVPPTPAAPSPITPPQPVETPTPAPDIEPSLEEVSNELSHLTPDDLKPVQPAPTQPLTPTPTTTGPALTPPTPGPELPVAEKIDSPLTPEEESTPPTPKEDIQPATPVPGSIGSAISVPPAEGTGENLELPEEPVVMDPSPFTQSSQPKRLRRLTSALLFILIILGLGVGGYYGWQYFQTQKSAIKSESESKPQETTPAPIEPSTTTINCQRNLAKEELTDFANAKSGTVELLVQYKDDDFDYIVKTTTILYPDEAAANLGLAPVKAQDSQYITTAGIKEDAIKSQYTVDQAQLVAIITSLQGFVLDHKTAIAFNFAIPPTTNTNKAPQNQTPESTKDTGNTSDIQTTENDDGETSESSESSSDQTLTSDDIKSAIESSGFTCTSESTTPLP